MKVLIAIGATVVLASTLYAQQPAAPDMTKGIYRSAADVAAAVAKLVTGGKLVEGVQTGDNWRGKAIEGGTAQKMSKGDFMMVPAGVPHWFTSIQGTITEMSIHLPMK